MTGIVHVPVKYGDGTVQMNVDYYEDPSGNRTPILGPGENHLGEVGGRVRLIGASTASITTTSSTTAYAKGQVISDNAAGNAMTVFQFPVARINGGNGQIRGLHIKTTESGALNAIIGMQLYRSAPTIAAGNGDHASWLTTESDWLARLDVVIDQQFNDATPLYAGITPVQQKAEVNFVANSSQNYIYGIMTAQSIFTPTGTKLWTPYLEVVQN